MKKKWIIIDEYNDENRFADSKEEAQEIALDWIKDGTSASDIRVFEIEKEYKVSSTVRLIAV